MNKEIAEALYAAGMNEPNVRDIAKAFEDHKEVHLLRAAVGKQIKQYEALDDHEPMCGGNPAYVEFINSMKDILKDSYDREDNREV